MKEKELKNTDEIVKNRIYGLDFLKIIAAFLVVFYHLGGLEFCAEDKIRYWPNINYIIYTLAAMSIPIFFMVNGALLMNKKYTYKQLIIKILKLVVLLVVWDVVKFPNWFFKTLIILYLMYPVLKYIFDCHKKILYIIIGTILIFPYAYNFLVVLAKLFALQKIPIWSIAGRLVSEYPRTGLFTMYSIPLFLFGGIQLKEKRKRKVYINLLLFFAGWIECVFESIIITRYTLTLHDSGNGNFPTIGALLMTVGIFNLIYDLNVGKYKKIVQFFSKNILMVYILHLMIIKILKDTVLCGVGSISLICAVIITVFIIFICTLIGELLSRIPVVKEFVKI